MSEEFERWFSEELKVKPKLWLLQDKQTLKIGWNAATESKQAKFDSQAEELAALRGFAKNVLDGIDYEQWLVEKYAERHGLIDADGNPKPLLTGEVNE